MRRKWKNRMFQKFQTRKILYRVIKFRGVASFDSFSANDDSPNLPSLRSFETVPRPIVKFSERRAGKRGGLGKIGGGNDAATTHLAIGLVTRNRRRLIPYKGPFTPLRRHVPSTSMLPVHAELPFRRGARIVAAPACVHFFAD